VASIWLIVEEVCVSSRSLNTAPVATLTSSVKINGADPTKAIQQSTFKLASSMFTTS
jgi:hypothetical protein